MQDPRDLVDMVSHSSANAAPDSREPAADSRTAHADANSNWLGLYFKCAGVYARAYKNNAGTAYRGRCPRCGKSMNFLIATGGTNRRNFEVSC